MKTDRHRPTEPLADVKHVADTRRSFLIRVLGLSLFVIWLGSVGPTTSRADESFTGGPAGESGQVASESNQVASESGRAKTDPEVSDPKAAALLQRSIQQLALGHAFDAKVRETVWATGREVVGVGTYEQGGMGTGQFNLQITMHDGDGKHRLQQISDGRLAWTRSEISGKVVLRRVDVGRLDEWVRQTPRSPAVAGEATTSDATALETVPPRLRIGAWTEMLDDISRDYAMRVNTATLLERPVLVVTGKLRKSVRARIMAESKRDEWPVLCPTKVRIAIAAEPDPETGFGGLLPTRIEYWSDPVIGSDKKASSEGRLITLIEIYSVRPIKTPPIERFRFNNTDSEVNFTNETERYIRRLGVELTASQKRLLRR